MFQYKDYQGSIEYSPEDGVHHGQVLGISDLVSYEADTIEALQSAFRESVDDYLQFCEQEGLEPKRSAPSP